MQVSHGAGRCYSVGSLCAVCKVHAFPFSVKSPSLRRKDIGELINQDGYEVLLNCGTCLTVME